MRLPPATHLLLGFTGPKAEAEEIKRRLAQFLQENLRLELSETKTLITHARTSAARFLGYEITVGHDNQRLTAGRRSANGRVRLHVPADVIKAKCAQHMRGGKPERRTGLMNEQDYAIISRYGAEYRGIVQYYLLAGDVWRLNRLHWVMLTSLLKTLAGKHGSSVSKMARKYAATIETPHGQRKCMQVRVERDEGRKLLVATFGGIPLRRQKNAVLIDRQPVREPARGSELIRRLQAGRCGSRTNGEGASAPDPQPRGAQQARPAAARMGASDGKAAAQDPDRLRHLPRQDPPRAANHDHDIVTGEPGDRKRSRRVREGGVGKGPARAPRRRRTSAACHPGAIEHRWSREVVLDATHAWREVHGWVPTSYDWSRTHARQRGGEALERLVGGEWPAASVVTALFGTWRAAHLAAEARSRSQDSVNCCEQ